MFQMENGKLHETIKLGTKIRLYESFKNKHIIHLSHTYYVQMRSTFFNSVLQFQRNFGNFDFFRYG